jgi:hypothetical protein
VAFSCFGSINAPNTVRRKRPTGYALIEAKRLKAFKYGREWLIDPKDLEAVKVRKVGRPRKVRKGTKHEAVGRIQVVRDVTRLVDPKGRFGTQNLSKKETFEAKPTAYVKILRNLSFFWTWLRGIQIGAFSESTGLTPFLA